MEYIKELLSHFQFIQEYFTLGKQLFAELSAANQFVAGVVSAWLLGVVTYLCRDVPSKFLAFLEKQFTVTLTVSNYDDLFLGFLDWYEEMGYGNHARTLRYTERWKNGERQGVISAGFGSHYFWYNWRPYKLVRYEKDASQTTKPKEEFTIRTIGRSQSAFREIVKLIQDRLNASDEEDKVTKIYKYSGSDWDYSHKQTPRPLDSVILPDEQKDKLIKAIKDFQESKSWFIDHGIPYRMGILLEGPPGTGKTSVVKALCGHFDKRLHLLNLKNMSDYSLENALCRLGPDSFVLIEDIDAQGGPTSRQADEEYGDEISDGDLNEITKDEGMTDVILSSSNPKKALNQAKRRIVDQKKASGATSFVDMFGLSLSGLLNAIDGISGSDGRILIMTTNHPEKLDHALLRPGRIDVRIRVDYLCRETFEKFFKRFYPHYRLPENVSFKEGITPAKFQGYVLENRGNPRRVLDLVSK